MRQTSKNIDPEYLISEMLTNIASEVPVHLNQGEQILLSVFLSVSKFTSITELLNDFECFIKEEIDLKLITNQNVSEVNFSALATKFGDRYKLVSILNLSRDNSEEIVQLGWKSTRTILVRVLRPQLQKIPYADAQQLVMVLEEFITSYSIIQGASTDEVFDNLKFWDVFKDYKFTLELDDGELQKPKELPPLDEFIRWAGRIYTVEQAGEALETEYRLITDKNQWIAFFENHEERIEVVPGQLNKLVAVLWQMEYNYLIDKSKNKGCWKIWQVILVDQNGKPSSQPLRKISSRINGEKSPRDQEDHEFGKRVMAKMMKNEKDNSSTN